MSPGSGRNTPSRIVAVALTVAMVLSPMVAAVPAAATGASAQFSVAPTAGAGPPAPALGSAGGPAAEATQRGPACELSFDGATGRVRGDGDTATEQFEIDEDCEATVRVSYTGDADLDAYLTYDGRQPERHDYDRRSVLMGAQNTFYFDTGELSRLDVTLLSERGGANYTVTVVERNTSDEWSWEDVDEAADWVDLAESAYRTANQTYQNWTWNDTVDLSSNFWQGAIYGEIGLQNDYEAADTAEYTAGWIAAGVTPGVDVLADGRDCATWSNFSGWMNYGECGFFTASAGSAILTVGATVSSGGTAAAASGVGASALEALDSAQAATIVVKSLDHGLRNAEEVYEVGESAGKVLELDDVDEVAAAIDDPATRRQFVEGVQAGRTARHLSRLDEAGVDARTIGGLRQADRVGTAGRFVEREGESAALLLNRMDTATAVRLLSVDTEGARAFRSTLATETLWSARAAALSEDGVVRFAVPDGHEALPETAREFVENSDEFEVVRVLDDGVGDPALRGLDGVDGATQRVIAQADLATEARAMTEVQGGAELLNRMNSFAVKELLELQAEGADQFRRTLAKSYRTNMIEPGAVSQLADDLRMLQRQSEGIDEVLGVLKPSGRGIEEVQTTARYLAERSDDLNPARLDTETMVDPGYLSDEGIDDVVEDVPAPEGVDDWREELIERYEAGNRWQSYQHTTEETAVVERADVHEYVYVSADGFDAESVRKHLVYAEMADERRVYAGALESSPDVDVDVTFVGDLTDDAEEVVAHADDGGLAVREGDDTSRILDDANDRARAGRITGLDGDTLDAVESVGRSEAARTMAEVQGGAELLNRMDAFGVRELLQLEAEGADQFRRTLARGHRAGVVDTDDVGQLAEDLRVLQNRDEEVDGLMSMLNSDGSGIEEVRSTARYLAEESGDLAPVALDTSRKIDNGQLASARPIADEVAAPAGTDYDSWLDTVGYDWLSVNSVNWVQRTEPTAVIEHDGVTEFVYATTEGLNARAVRQQAVEAKAFGLANDVDVEVTFVGDLTEDARYVVAESEDVGHVRAADAGRVSEEVRQAVRSRLDEDTWQVVESADRVEEAATMTEIRGGAELLDRMDDRATLELLALQAGGADRFRHTLARSFRAGVIGTDEAAQLAEDLRTLRTRDRTGVGALMRMADADGRGLDELQTTARYLAEESGEAAAVTLDAGRQIDNGEIGVSSDEIAGEVAKPAGTSFDQWSDTVGYDWLSINSVNWKQYTDPSAVLDRDGVVEFVYAAGDDVDATAVRRQAVEAKAYGIAEDVDVEVTFVGDLSEEARHVVAESEDVGLARSFGDDAGRIED